MAASRAAMTSESKCGRCANFAPLNGVHGLAPSFSQQENLSGVRRVRRPGNGFFHR